MDTIADAVFADAISETSISVVLRKVLPQCITCAKAVPEAFGDRAWDSEGESLKCFVFWWQNDPVGSTPEKYSEKY